MFTSAANPTGMRWTSSNSGEKAGDSRNQEAKSKTSLDSGILDFLISLSQPSLMRVQSCEKQVNLILRGGLFQGAMIPAKTRTMII